VLARPCRLWVQLHRVAQEIQCHPEDREGRPSLEYRGDHWRPEVPALLGHPQAPSLPRLLALRQVRGDRLHHQDLLARALRRDRRCHGDLVALAPQAARRGPCPQVRRHPAARPHQPVLVVPWVPQRRQRPGTRDRPWVRPDPQVQHCPAGHERPVGRRHLDHHVDQQAQEDQQLPWDPGNRRFPWDQQGRPRQVRPWVHVALACLEVQRGQWDQGDQGVAAGWRPCGASASAAVLACGSDGERIRASWRAWR